MEKSPLMQVIELRRGERLEEIIRRQVEAGMTQEQIALDLGVSYHTLRYWLGRLGAKFSTTVCFQTETSQVAGDA